jgi:PAS domain S-box-containing protein
MEEKKYTNLDILLLEDVDFDAELIRRHLAKNNLIGHFRHVTNLKDFQSEIENRIPTVVLSDYQLQGNTGLDAIKYRNSKGLIFPFIFVTSSENESIAVECLKAGASDYILKDKLFVLPSAIHKAVEKYYTDQEVIQTRKALIKREKLLEAIADISQMFFSESEINTAFQKLISIIGPASGQDRAYLFETKTQSGSNNLLFDMNFEWVAEGISPQINNNALKNLDVFQVSPDTYNTLSEGKQINTVFSELPVPLHDFFESQKILSFLLIPIRVNNKLRAAIGFDNCHSEYKWNQSDMDAFQTIRSLIENFIIRRQDELALRENEEKYRLLAENSSDVIWTMDSNGKYLYVSPAVFNLRGITPEENLNDSIEDTLTPESANLARQMFAEMKPLIEQGGKPEPLTLVLEQKCKWGGTVWTEVIVSGVYDENGLFKYILGVTRDINARKKTEDELIQSRQLFQTLTTMSPVGVFRTNPEGLTTYVNPRWCHLAGLTSSKALGNKWMDAVHPDDIDKVSHHWKNTWINKGSSELEYRFRHSDGSVVWIIGNIIPEFQNDEIIGYIGTITDITSRRDSETALRESEERFRNAITHAPIPIMIHSEGEIIQLSNSFLDITGLNKDELKNLDQWHEIASPVEDIFSNELNQQPNKTNSGVIKGTWRVVSINQPRIWEFSSSVIGTLGEGKQVVTSMAMDVTHKKQMEEDLFKSRQELNAIFQGAPILMFLINNQKEIIKVNQTAVNYTDITRQDILNKRMGQALNCVYCKSGTKCLEIPECSNCSLNKMVDSVYLKERKKITVEQMELTLQIDDKQVKRIFFAHAEMLFSDPEARILFTLLDITDRIEAEEELKKSEIKFRNLVANAPVGIALVNSKGFIVDVNNTAVRIFGFDSAEEIIGKLSEDFYLDKTERKIFIEQLGKDTAKGLETQMVDRFGNQIWLMETAVKHIFPNGDTGHLSILEDISHRKENEAKIRAYQENLEDLINNRTHQLENTNRELSKFYKAVEFSPSTVVITDKNGTIEYVNPRFCEVTGYTLQEAIGVNPRIIKSDDTPTEYYSKLWNTILSGKSWYGQFKNRKKNGETFWELCAIAPILDVNNDITHFVAVKQDITESILAEEKMKNYTKELEIFNKTMIDRELRMIEMKEDVNRMCRQLGIPEKYATTWNL